MVTDNTDSHGTAFTVTVDAVGTGTGVSAADRTTTVRALAEASTTPAQLRRPGHVFPLIAREGGVLVRAGHTEAAVELTTMAGLSGDGVIGEIVDEDGSMRRGASLSAFAAEHGLPVLAIADLVRSGEPPSGWSSWSARRRCRRSSAPSAPWRTGAPSTGRNTSRWSWATSRRPRAPRPAS